jgi:hypothetical protein
MPSEPNNPKEGKMSEWLHLATTNDTNGNPRRLYVEVEDGMYKTIVNEGYEGYARAHRAGMPETYLPPRIHITPAEYRTLRKLAKPA